MKRVYELRASNAHRWMNCVGQPQAVLGLPDSSNEAADRGTVAHALLEVMLRLDYPTDEIDRFADKPLLKAIDGRDATGIIVDEEMMNGVGYALDYVRSYLARYPTATYEIEARLDATSFIGYETGGTSDVLLLDLPREIVVVDYKNGVQHVDHTDNEQLHIYGLGAINEYSSSVTPETNIRMAIVQPNSRFDSGAVREADYSYDDLLAFAARAAEAAKAAHSKTPPRIAGDHCGFCRAAGSCKVYADYALESAALEFANLGAEMRVKDPRNMKPADLAMVMRSAAVLRSWLTAVEGEATRLLLDHKKVPGYKLVGSITHRKWDDPEKVQSIVKNVVPADIYDELAPRTILSPARMEKRLGRKKDGMPVLLGRLLKRITHGATQPRVAPEADSRPPYIAGAEFSDD